MGRKRRGPKPKSSPNSPPQLSLGKSLDFPISALSSKNRDDDPKSVSAVTKQGWRKYRTTLDKRIKLSWELSRKRIMGGEKAAAKPLRRGNTRQE